MAATSKAGMDLLTKQRYLPNANSGGLHQRRYLTEAEMTERMYRIPATGSGHEMKPPGVDLLKMRKGHVVELLNDVPADFFPPVWASGTKAIVKYACVFSDEVDLRMLKSDGSFDGYFDRVMPNEIQLAEPLIEYDNECARDGEE